MKILRVGLFFLLTVLLFWVAYAAFYLYTHRDTQPPMLLNIETGYSAVALSPDQSLLFAAYSHQRDDTQKSEATIKMWRLDEAATAPSWQWQCVGYAANDISVSSDGEILAVACTDGKARLWSVPTGKFLRAIPVVEKGTPTGATAVAFSSAKLMLAVGAPTTRLFNKSPDPNIRSTIRIFDQKGAKLQHKFYIGGDVRTMRFAPTGQKLAAFCGMHGYHNAFGKSGYTGVADAVYSALYDVRNGKELVNSAQVFSYIPQDALSFSRDASLFLVGRMPSDLLLYNLSKPETIPQLGIVPSTTYHAAANAGFSGKLAAEISPDGKHIAVGHDDGIEFYSASTGKLQYKLSAPNSLDFIKYSLDGARLLAIDKSGDVFSYQLN